MLLVAVAFALPLKAQDSTIAYASRRYVHSFITERIFIGTNYRSIWALPVTVRILHLQSEQGGLIVKEMGGGMQTKSLHLEDNSGNKWALRSLDKTVDKAMEAEGIRNKRVIRFSQKMLSSSHPYGALSMPPMANALGIVSTGPQLVFVPDDPLLGSYRSLFANTLCLLELREPKLYKDDEVKGTEDMLTHLNDKDYVLDARMLLQARLLDMLVGDWDRHDDQWKWEYHKQDNGTTSIIPIPRDHDQAYFNSTGVFISLARLFNIHMFPGYRRALKLTALNYKAWYLDKTLLKGLSEDDWRTGIQRFQSRLTDRVLNDAVRRFPAQVYQKCGAHIYSLLKTRRDKMLRAGIGYYHFLQSHPRKIEREYKKEKEKGARARKLKDSMKKGT